MTIEIEDGIIVTIHRTFSASPARVWDAFVMADQAPLWMWGANAANPSAKIDLRVGGRYRIEMDAPPGKEDDWHSPRWAMSGVYVEIVEQTRLIYTLHWDGPVGYNQNGGEVLDEAVIVEFAGLNDATLLTFRHIGIPPDGVSAAEHSRGVDATFDDLVAFLAEGSSDGSGV